MLGLMTLWQQDVSQLSACIRCAVWQAGVTLCYDTGDDSLRQRPLNGCSACRRHSFSGLRALWLLFLAVLLSLAGLPTPTMAQSGKGIEIFHVRPACLSQAS